LEKTSTAKEGSGACAAALAAREVARIAKRSGRGLDRELTEFGAGRSFRLTTTRRKEIAMKWKTPVIIEIAVGLEINAYACAEIK
jgi:coenzyme PQQ precursor peptide PqqA